MPRYSGKAHQTFIAAVQKHSFTFALPPISRSFNTSHDHFEVDEYIGDSLLGSAILVVLRGMYPKITAPGIYSDIKAATASNSSLFHLMRKAGQVSDRYPSRFSSDYKHISRNHWRGWRPQPTQSIIILILLR
ncbi:hypothetical protein FIBSPDRAFT_542170 [Athelia psychrophila]|uniref:RNase III domain-containing protein n=1 Tax=Athelia psychrophila TaxID=1759441 RepID=A0A166J034_9AGAM|nr:hypothetical protein FIBSPDRAFT_542170 [Fibularhizoctonia sp. CBS 109695]